MTRAKPRRDRTPNARGRGPLRPGVPAAQRWPRPGDWLRRHPCAPSRHVQWMRRRRLRRAGRRTRLPAAAPDGRALVQQPRRSSRSGLFWGVWWPFGHPARCSSSGARGAACSAPKARLTEAASRVGLGPRGAALAEMGRLAVRRVRADHGLRPARQRLSVSGGHAAGARRIDRAAAIGVGLRSTGAASARGAGTCARSTACSRCCRARRRCISASTAPRAANAGRIPVHPVNCAPLVRIRRMTGPVRMPHVRAAAALRWCDRAGSALAECVEIARHAAAPQARAWDACLIVFGMIGLALGAFEWSAPQRVRRAACGRRSVHRRSWSGSGSSPTTRHGGC